MGHKPGRWRRRPLPRNWESELRPYVLDRDGHRCQWPMRRGGLCKMPARDVDHIDPDGPDEEWNLRALCPHHHASKTGREGAAARWAGSRLPPEQHPGLLRKRDT